MQKNTILARLRKQLGGGFLLLLALSGCATLANPADERMALLNRSRLLLDAGQIESARQLTQETIARFGPSPFLLNQMALIRDREGQPEMAFRILTHAHRLYPNATVLTLNLADMELVRHEPGKARETLRPILDRKSWPNGFRTLMGRIDLDSGNLPEAHLFLHEALVRHPDNPLLLANMGLLHSRMGLRKKAREEFRMAAARSRNPRLKSRLEALLSRN